MYRIGTAARLSGVDAMTIRNWERRYKVLAVSRGPGGQRVYSMEDIDRLRWLKSQLESGLSASEAHDLLRRHIASGNGFLHAVRVRADAQRMRAEAIATRARVEAWRRERDAAPVGAGR
jgi:DNA-binding transcriptional MerR regulator